MHGKIELYLQLNEKQEYYFKTFEDGAALGRL